VLEPAGDERLEAGAPPAQKNGLICFTIPPIDRDRPGRRAACGRRPGPGPWDAEVPAETIAGGRRGFNPKNGRRADQGGGRPRSWCRRRRIATNPAWQPSCTAWCAQLGGVDAALSVAHNGAVPAASGRWKSTARSVQIRIFPVLCPEWGLKMNRTFQVRMSGESETGGRPGWQK